MDSRSSAQDVHRCDLCETAIVNSYCDFCHVNLCKPCVVDHISDGYDKHKIVQFQERRLTLIYPKCGAHPNKNCDLQCENCNNIFICSSCTASNKHRGHIFVEVSEIYNAKKKIIKKKSEELENLISPKYEKIAIDLENQLANLDVGYEKLTTTISKQGEEWHREIDIVFNKMKTEISMMQVKHRYTLQKHLDEIKQIQSLIKQTLLAIKEIEKSTEVSHTIEYSSTIRECSNFPPKVNVSLPTFIPKPINREKLYSLYGQITPLLIVTEQNLNKPITSVRELLDEPEHIATIPTEYEYIRSVTCLNEDCVWTSGSTKDIKCYSVQGVLLQTISNISEQPPLDIAVDRDGNLHYCDRRSRVDQDGNLRWRYTGHSSVTKNKLFEPFGITTDSQSHILTADFNNHCIHILDQNGQFLRYIENCYLGNPYGLCVDNNDNLFVSEYYKGNVKEIKFLR